MPWLLSLCLSTYWYLVDQSSAQIFLLDRVPVPVQAYPPVQIPARLTSYLLTRLASESKMS